MYNVVIVDDHEIFRSGMKLLLRKQGLFNKIFEAENGREYIQLIKNQKIDLAFIDIRMPVLNGFESVTLCRDIAPYIKIIILTTYEDTEFFLEMLKSDVEGYMLKSSTVEDFQNAIKKVLNNENYYSNKLVIELSKNLKIEVLAKEAKNKFTELTNREREILKLICEGLSNQQIAIKLKLSKRTIERHKSNLLYKTKTQNTLNLVIYTFKNNLIN